MTFEFITREFRFSHGKEPKGRGGWAFKIEGREMVWAPSGTYAEAKTWAKAEARKIAPPGYAGNVRIEVCP